MNLTKKEREEVTKVYDTWLNSYLTGDVKTYDSFFDDRYHFIGSTGNEHFLDRRDTTQFFADTGDQFAGKTKIKNNTRTIEKFDGLIFVTEIFDTFFLIEDEWTYYGKFRFTSALKKNKEGWRFVYQHFSTPDSKADEGETIGTQKIAAENLMLKEAVRRRTAELEDKTRELEIESALERVRTTAMAMQKPDDLMDVCQIISEQLETLGVDNIRNTQLAIIDDEKKNYANYQYFNAYAKRVFEETNFEDNFASNAMVTEMQKSVNSFFIGNIEGEELEEFREWRKRDDQFPDPLLDEKAALYYYFYSIGKGGLGLTTYEEISGESLEIFKRFHKIFTLAYRRFMDIQQAEAQAREAQIEAALEKVRSRTMAMQHSDELPEAANILFNEVQALGINAWSAGYNILSEDKRSCACVMSSEGTLQAPFLLPFTREKSFNEWFGAIQSGTDFFVQELGGQDIKEHYEYLMSLPGIDKAIEGLEEAGIPFPTYQVNHLSFFSKGFLLFITYEPVPEAHTLFKRFTAVFEQTYTRFLDLKHAEEQAKEAKVELSLERIRSQVTSMNESAELLDIMVMMRKEFVALGHEAHYFWYMRYLPDKYEKAMTSGDGTRIGMVMTLPRHIHGDIKLVADWEKGDEPTLIFPMDTETAVDYVHKMITLGDFKQVDPNAPTLDDIRALGGLTFIMARSNYGEIGFSLPGYVDDPPQEALDTLARFAGVFDLAYRRFEDLKTAERQNRETQIELALEKVRSKTMAMHCSQDVASTVVTLFDEVMKLGLDSSLRCGIGILDKTTDHMETWSASYYPDGEVDLKTGMLDMRIHPMLVGLKKAWNKGKSDYHYDYIGDDVLKYYTALNNEPEYPFQRDLETLPENEYHRSFFYKEGILFAFAPNPISDESARVLNRFAQVFGQTYRRYLDLQKAEAQAREAQIEASLERIRYRALAMHKSEDVGTATTTMFTELDNLGVEILRCGILIFEKPDSMEAWSVTNTIGGKKIRGSGKIDMNAHRLWQLIHQAWKRKDEFLFYKLAGDDKEAYYNIVSSQVNYSTSGKIKEMPDQYCQVYFLGKGAIWTFSREPHSEKANEVLRRFTSVFSLTFQRFLDLRTAEAQKREAQIETALEKVRVRAMAMQEPEELKDVARVLRHEMGLLGVEELETSSIYIKQKDNSEAECWYALKDAGTTKKSLVSDYFALNLNDTDVGRRMMKFYSSSKKKTSIKMTGKPRKEWIHYCEKKSKPLRGYYGENIPDRTYHLYKFSNGAIGAATPGEISDESWGLLKRAASVFSLAYSRFSDLTQARIDLKKLKTEKKRAEDALSNLKSTQAQLIHAEKMASLGELTAGIAHEIQNPLNFVNNFSEVSVELVEEIIQELTVERSEIRLRRVDSKQLTVDSPGKSGSPLQFDRQLAEEILDDIRQNLEKINHHGKRADSIVKGMLQHSRTGSSEKELTDINVLADEYLRLAYHGLRAKDKTFNADFTTEFADELPRVKVMAQDIGRVLLNLINNAFYAVSARALASADGVSRASAEADSGYKPHVTVRTKKLADHIEIRVTDNGGGVPEKVVEKIFQPFFTTKPTGDGTGLGLSLAYDIIKKGHGGELKLENKPGEGAEFVIFLPVS